MEETKKYPQLIFPPLRLSARREGGDTLIFDTVRRQWVVLTPEEWVRQHLIGYLIHSHGILSTSIIEEYPVDLNGQPQRADVVAMGADLKPLLLVECKAPEVKLSDAVRDQAVRYNSVVRSQAIMLTNGLAHRFFTTDDFVHYTEIASLW